MKENEKWLESANKDRYELLFDRFGVHFYDKKAGDFLDYEQIIEIINEYEKTIGQNLNNEI